MHFSFMCLIDAGLSKNSYISNINALNYADRVNT